ncbi:MAG: hydrogenase 2 large subunit [Nitrospirae bacterium CG_4_9_14_3_um_filter_53_35]|nr:MAG: hydrogenase 2 large subunit [Nitrospirae bacterium CG2_30_53_67]PIS36307.1 MAG: hydrogenase 2 large subunit [Nitrospirae bacterium CG08_land_8_20_14_0_20_52_24]PIV85433.1 MAG: hydrogenase 2 large subunit [Nitrospirae bacterium CG17_big_fil_post_rev_8_21_14_2_50_50_9]PIW85069.1 MAG: hydrogenase 2 large subunit [Nitrospirae bacterium CG_4_8_14_3_um_filter_50_41]PIX85529.1 MAG: hydrogenase 2 large subunit [Nitrospirae bacterium CG_4_10_14_3_um_filter_53_41]PJA72773.1 MAG: hydrogenase 2 la
MAKRIVVDPITRIEGHLRIDCEVDGGKITNAWSSGQMWRGIEVILKGRDPREAWIFTQRICGVCTTVHAVASVRCVENALGMEVPMNAQHIRNLIIGAHGVHDHMVHFYHLAALDWVDIVSALKADPRAAAQLGQKLSPWPRNTYEEIKAAQERLQGLVDSGQLGVYGSGYWGHPAMKLAPEVNLLAAVHYLQALEYQREINKVVGILGSKTPHIQNLAVGGVANPINPESQSTLTLERLYYVKSLIDKVGEFVEDVMLVDTAAVGAFYADWTGYGKGVTDYLSVPDMPMDTRGTVFALPGGYIPNGDISKFTPIKSYHDDFFMKNVKESIKHSWYDGDWNRHPWDEDTAPKYTDFQDNGKYSWVKSPSFQGKPAQVGPLANVLCMYAAGHEPTKKYVDKTLATVSSLAGTKVGVDALHSTIGRIAARSVRCAVLYDTLKGQWQALMENIAKGDMTTYNRPVFPKGEQRGFGFHEAPRGTLSHWIVIQDGRIGNYQAVVPSTWNAGPRNDEDALGPYEASLIGNPVADPERPLEVLRTIHSFDPCLACAIHLVDKRNHEIVRVKAL